MLRVEGADARRQLAAVSGSGLSWRADGVLRGGTGFCLSISRRIGVNMASRGGAVLPLDCPEHALAAGLRDHVAQYVIVDLSVHGELVAFLVEARGE